MQRCYHRNFRFIGVMFWAFPYLLWQAFGHISGFFVGVVLAIVLTTMLNNTLRANSRQAVPFAHRQPLAQEAEPRYFQKEPEPYQRGYRAEPQQSPAQQPAPPSQPQYEDMLVQYPQEMPPMEQR